MPTLQPLLNDVNVYYDKKDKVLLAWQRADLIGDRRLSEICGSCFGSLPVQVLIPAHVALDKLVFQPPG